MKKIKQTIKDIFASKKMTSQGRHEDEIRKYTKEAIKTYNKTLRKLAYE